MKAKNGMYSKLLLLLPILLIFSCTKTIDREWMVYHETSCQPGWVDLDSDRKSRLNLEGFLKGNGIVPLKIKVRGDRIQSCRFCDCATGKTYRVQVDESQTGQLQYFGFDRE